jgi:hypothetical protein
MEEVVEISCGSHQVILTEDFGLSYTSAKFAP